MDPAKEKLARELLTRERLTAPHYLAYSWVYERLSGGGKDVLDFGARYSLLPTILALYGHRVAAVDRDPVVVEKQREISAAHGVKVDALQWQPGDGLANDLRFDAVTACWAIQHNTPDQQSEIVKRLVEAMKPGGKLLIVAAYTCYDSAHETARPDPLWRFNDEDLHRYLVKPSRCKVTDIRRFHYEHGTTKGEWCGPNGEPNATAFELTKGAK